MALLRVDAFAIFNAPCLDLRIFGDSLLSTSHPWHLDLTLTSVTTAIRHFIAV